MRWPIGSLGGRFSAAGNTRLGWERRQGARISGHTATPLPRQVSTVLTHQTATSGRAGSRSRAEDLPGSVRMVLTRIAVGDHVAPTALADAFQASVDLPAPTRDVVLGSLMTAVMARGPVADDVEALLRSALEVDDRTSAEMISGGDRPVLMLAGSGKKGLQTLNVSTPAALVAAAAGARVIKVGSTATSSALGSRDLVRALGLHERRTAGSVRADLNVSGFAFVAIEPEIPVLDQLYGGRFSHTESVLLRAGPTGEPGTRRCHGVRPVAPACGRGRAGLEPFRHGPRGRAEHTFTQRPSSGRDRACGRAALVPGAERRGRSDRR